MRFLRPLLAILPLMALASAGTNPVLGRMGQTTVDAEIYAAPNVRARVFYHSKPFEYLVVRSSKEDKWLQVLLRTGVYGYISKSSVAILPYEVTSKPVARSAPRTQTALTSRSGSAVANYSLNFIGTPYVWGGNDVRNGIDCSGFVKKMYGEIGVQLPRTAAEQAMVGMSITRLEQLQSGDRLYFWSSKRNKIGHTGIYMGNGYFVHSSTGHAGVATDYLTPKWRQILVAARR
jgi:cell wall-associated NlpC family hydrolase